MKKIIQYFQTPCEAIKIKFKNKNKRLLRSEIIEMINEKTNKMVKNDLITIWQLLNNMRI